MGRPDAITLLLIVARTATIYLLLLLAMRLTGKRQVAQITPFDLVLLLLISNAVQNAMTGPDTSLLGGIVAAATLLFLNFVISRVRLQTPALDRMLEGEPTVLVYHGEIVSDNLDREGITKEELQAAMREHEVSDLSEIALAMLEVDGTISVVRVKPDHPGNFARSRRRMPRHGEKNNR